MKALRQTEDYTTAVSGPLVVQIWHKATTVQGVDSLSLALAGQLKTHKSVFVLHVTMTTQAPDGAARDRIRQITGDYSERTLASALVFEGMGFGAATVRAVVAGIALVARHPFPYRVFAYVGAALEWFASFPLEPAHAAIIAQAQAEIIELRSIHSARYSIRPSKRPSRRVTSR
ncbi:MAG: hypothetical protein ABW321_15765 [Polyangiales bacterium]